MSKKILLLDTETTGLDPSVDRCIEVAVCLYDLERACPLFSYASLIPADSNAAEPTNRIPASVLSSISWMPEPWGTVQFLVEDAPDVVAIMAHRAEFDRGFVPSAIRDARPWVCSKFHVAWPNGKPGDHLTHLALAHGIGVVHAHRAMSDVDTLARLLTRVHEMGTPLVPLIDRAMRPRTKVQALVSYDDRELAKSAGFAWDAQRRIWHREMFVDEVAALGFQTRPLAAP